MKAHIIEDGKVINTIEVDLLDFIPGLVEATVGGIGWDYIDGAFVAPYVAPVEISYQVKRSSEYPPMANYLDGIVKGDTAQVQAYIDACLAVKAKYPKPE
jgi:hypothetical protein